LQNNAAGRPTTRKFVCIAAPLFYKNLPPHLRFMETALTAGKQKRQTKDNA
jgi:hypothetical protein